MNKGEYKRCYNGDNNGKGVIPRKRRKRKKEKKRKRKNKRTDPFLCVSMDVEKGDESGSTDAPVFVTPKHPEGASSPEEVAVTKEREKKKSGEDIKTLFNRRNELERQLQECEEEIYSMETNYFERSISNGNCGVVAGWYGFITPSVSGPLNKHGTASLTGSTGYGSTMGVSGGRDGSQGVQSQTRKSGGGAGGSGNGGIGGTYKLRDTDRIFSLSSVTSKASKQAFQGSSTNGLDKKTIKFK